MEKSQVCRGNIMSNKQAVRQIVDGMPGLILTATAAGATEFVNQQLLAYFGKTMPTSCSKPRKPPVDCFNAKIERYPNHLGRTVLWAGATAIYGVREHPGEDVATITVKAWL